ncbi:MAG: flagellar hook-length control protein FliK, partial [Thermotogota bacterium]
LDAADSSPLEAEPLQLLRDTVRELFGQFNEGLFKNTSKVADSKEAVDNTVDLSEMKIDIPEKFVESLSESLNISKEAIIDFLNSNLIPQEKLQPFIQSFNTSDIQAFIQNNEALLSQMKAFIKLHHHSDSGSKLTLHTRSVTVETMVIKQMILNQFNSKEFSSEWMNSKEPIVFKSPQSVFKVEKLSIRFINKGGQTETSDKSGFKNSDGDFLEKAAQTTKRIFQPTFKNGYETTSQRMTDLERFHAKTSNNESQSEHLANKTGKTISFDEKASLSEKSSETKFQSVSMNEEKDVKGAKSTVDQENQTHQNELKVGRNSTDAVLKNEPSNEAKNLEQVYQKIKDMTQLIARQQTRSELATIKLNPPELGKVSLEVMKEGNKISILMQVETKEAQEILNKNSSALAARLVSSGFELQKVTVQMEKYEEQGENQPNQNGQENSEQQQNENQDTDNNNEYTYEEEYTFSDLLKGGIEENAS